MGIIGKNDLIVADVLDGGLGLALVTRDKITFDQCKNKVAVEVAKEPHAIARVNRNGSAYITFFVFA